MRTEFICSSSVISVPEFGTTCKFNGLAMVLMTCSKWFQELEEVLATLSSWRF
jgi:hypothetical protein